MEVTRVIENIFEFIFSREFFFLILHYGNKIILRHKSLTILGIYDTLMRPKYILITF